MDVQLLQVSNQRLSRQLVRQSLRSVITPEVQERYPDLTYELLMEQMYLVTPAGKRYGGSGWFDITRRLPALWLIAVLHFPGTARLWRWLYKQVAKRRYKLAGKTCEGDSWRPSGKTCSSR